jgi:hypothetical protein
MEEQFPLILDNLLLKLETFYLQHADPILSRSYLPPSKTTVRNKIEYNFFRRKFEAAILFEPLEDLIGPLLRFENLFSENFVELFNFYLGCDNHFVIQKLITNSYYFNRISEEITPYFKFLVQLLDTECKCRSFNITAECIRLIYFINDVLSNLSRCLKPVFQVTINFNLLASKRQVFRQTFDGSKGPFLSEYVKGNLRLTSNVRFWLDYIVEKEEISDNLFSISSLTNQNISNRGMIEQAYGWFGSIFPRGCTKLQFLRMFAGYFVEKILKVYWKQKAEFLVGEVDYWIF